MTTFGDSRLPARFWSKVEVADSGCWLWTASKNLKGYGQYSFDHKPVGSHRIAYRAMVGPIKKGDYVDHQCYNRHCVNPTHLRLVSNKENIENRSGLNKNNKSGYRGVSWSAKAGKWQVSVKHLRKSVAGGMFNTPEEANQAAIALRNRLHRNNLLDRQVD